MGVFLKLFARQKMTFLNMSLKDIFLKFSNFVPVFYSILYKDIWTSNFYCIWKTRPVFFNLFLLAAPFLTKKNLAAPQPVNYG
jgi:hypothetical protein